MKYGFVYPIGNVKAIANAAEIAEKSGWDGFFVWEPIYGIDAWVALTACVLKTKTIKLGTMLSPLPRMRPWKLASETVTLDNLSGGRIILAVGLGALDNGWLSVGELQDRKIRAELLDEGLDLLNKFWQGKPFSFTGKHFKIDEYKSFMAPPVIKQPKIPIWCVGALGYEKSMSRVFKYEGILPTLQKKRQGKTLTVDDVKDIKKTAIEKYGKNNFDIIIPKEHLPDDFELNKKNIMEYEKAGGTWWIEGMWELMSKKNPEAEIIERIKKGPISD